MPSPIGHSLAGYVIASFKSGSLFNKNLSTVLLFVFVANAPDLDFIPGIIIGKPNMYHHGVSHSLGVGILFSLVLAVIINFKKHWNILRDFGYFVELYLLHLVLDYFSYDGRPPIGIPIFWPLSNEFFMFPSPIFPGIHHSHLDDATISQFLADIFSYKNLYSIGVEVLGLMVLFIIVAIFLKFNRSSKTNN